jgi:hypothetical protein
MPVGRHWNIGREAKSSGSLYHGLRLTRKLTSAYLGMDSAYIFVPGLCLPFGLQRPTQITRACVAHESFQCYCVSALAADAEFSMPERGCGLDCRPGLLCRATHKRVVFATAQGTGVWRSVEGLKELRRL